MKTSLPGNAALEAFQMSSFVKRAMLVSCESLGLSASFVAWHVTLSRLTATYLEVPCPRWVSYVLLLKIAHVVLLCAWCSCAICN